MISGTSARRVRNVALLCTVLFLTRLAFAADDSLRPLYHFTAERGWMNDPNGLVYDGTQYHLFFQHYAKALHSEGDFLTWGHATSRDLMHWTQLPEAIEPIKLPDGKSAGAWSGTAVIDRANTSGFGAADHPPMVLFWTATHLGQYIEYSTDRGRTFTRYAGNPIIPKPVAQQGDWDRDPDVFWYEPGRHWVMIYSISHRGFVVNTSTDLKHWTRHDIVPGFYECPNCFELPVDGDPGNRKWVLWDASGTYRIGTFDGEKFIWETGPLRLDHGRNYYAAQTWSDAPDGRRIGIAWMNGGRFPNQIFNQQMGIPFELSLRTIPGLGVRLVKYPIREVESLRHDATSFHDLTLRSGSENPLSVVHGQAIDIEATVKRPAGATLTLDAADQTIVWNDDTIRVGAASAKISALNRADLRILIDRASIEVYLNHGRVSFTNSILPTGKPAALSLSAAGGEVKILSMTVWQLRPTIENP